MPEHELMIAAYLERYPKMTRDEVVAMFDHAWSRPGDTT